MKKLLTIATAIGILGGFWSAGQVTIWTPSMATNSLGNGQNYALSGDRLKAIGGVSNPLTQDLNFGLNKATNFGTELLFSSNTFGIGLQGSANYHLFATTTNVALGTPNAPRVFIASEGLSSVSLKVPALGVDSQVVFDSSTNGLTRIYNYRWGVGHPSGIAILSSDAEAGTSDGTVTFFEDSALPITYTSSSGTWDRLASANFIGPFTVDATDFVLNTLYTNGIYRTTVAASFTLNAAAAGTAKVTMYVKAQDTTLIKKLTISSGPLASLTVIDTLSLRVGPGEVFSFVDEKSGAGATDSVVTGTCSVTTE